MKVTIAAGGTGGHLFPAEALGAALRARGHAVALMTDRRTADRAARSFDDIAVIDGAGMVGKSGAARVRAAVALARGTVAARAALVTDALVAFGGYPSVPPVLAARLRLGPRPIVLLHDQNAVLGRANRFLARMADAVATSFDRIDGVPSRTRTVVTGNPVRAAIEQVGPYRPPLAGDTLELLVLGGSLGARVFSDVVPAALGVLARRVRVTQQARPEDVDRVWAAYDAIGVEAAIAPFFPDIAPLLARSHLVIARAGGSTVAELCAAGRPSILIPLPIAVGDEQGANAGVLDAAGAALRIREPAFTPEHLAAELARLADASARLDDMARRARELARPGAGARLAMLVETLATPTYDVRSPIRACGSGIGA